jgi:hypothetical protein
LSKFVNLQLCAVDHKYRFDQNIFYLDSGSSKHIVNNLRFFSEYYPFNKKEGMVSINGGYALGIGKVKVTSRLNNKKYYFTLKNVLYINKSPCNIISTLALENSGCNLVSSRNKFSHHLDIYYANTKLISAGTL